MKLRAHGTFEVVLRPQPKSGVIEDTPIGRMSIDKIFRGELEGTGKGEMLMAGTAVAGSAAYVAIERVDGALHGRRGSFVLRHTGTMTRGTPELVVVVVPDSGTGALEGLSGTMAITITGAEHFYDFDGALPGEA